MAMNIIVPSVPHHVQQIQIRDQYEVWRVAFEQTQPKFVIENIHFEHDPEWRHSFVSLTYAGSGESYFWNGVGGLFVIAQAGWPIALVCL
jgi:hypothetical protein